MRVSSTTKNNPPTLGTLELREMIVQYQHLLVCLEADLKDRNRSGALSDREFNKRAKKLRSVEREIDTLQKVVLTDQTGLTPKNDIGLPIIENCSPSEQETYEHSLMEKEIELLRIEQHTAKAHSWLRDAIEGKTGSLLLTLRLSSLRRMIHFYTKLLTRAQAERDHLEVSSEELIKSLSKGKSDARPRTTLETLVSLFKDLESTISRVAKMRATLKRESSKVREMNAWLKNEETKFECGLETERFLTPMNLAASTLFNLGQSHIIDPKAIKKRKLIEQFWSEVIAQQKNTPIDESDFSKYFQSSPIETTQSSIKPKSPPNSKLPNPSRKVRRKKTTSERQHD